MSKLILIATMAAVLTGPAQGQDGAAKPEEVPGREVSRLEPLTDAPVTLAYAGVKLALPKGFLVQTSEDGSEVIRASRLEKDEPIVATSLVAVPLGAKVTLAAFAENMQPRSVSNQVIRNLKTLKVEPTKILGLEGEVRILSYYFRNVETSAVRVFFIRPTKDERLKIAYVLTVEASKQHGKHLMPTLSAIVGSLELVELVSPAAENVELAPEPVVNRKYGMSIRPPRLWKVIPAGASVQMFQTDYVNGGRPLPMAQLGVVPASQTSQQIVRRQMDSLAETVRKQKRELRTVREGEAKMGQRPGYEIIAKEEPLEGQPDDLVAAGQRAVVIDGRCYWLLLVYPADKIDNLTAAMELLASTFTLAAPATAPATAPSSGAPPKEASPLDKLLEGATTAPAKGIIVAPGR